MYQLFAAHCQDHIPDEIVAAPGPERLLQLGQAAAPGPENLLQLCQMVLDRYSARAKGAEQRSAEAVQGLEAAHAAEVELLR